VATGSLCKQREPSCTSRNDTFSGRQLWAPLAMSPVNAFSTRFHAGFSWGRENYGPLLGSRI